MFHRHTVKRNRRLCPRIPATRSVEFAEIAVNINMLTKNLRPSLVTAAFCAAVFFTLGASSFALLQDGGKKKLTAADLPAAVRATVDLHGEKGNITKIDLEDEGGVKVYEVAVEKDKRKIEVITTADGQLIETEEVVEATALPEAAKTRMGALLRGAEKIKIERKLAVLYEVSSKINDKKVSYYLTPLGHAQQDVQAAAGATKDHDDDDDDDNDKGHAKDKK